MAPIFLLKVGAKKRSVVKLIGDYEMWFQRAIPEENLGIIDLRDDDVTLPKDIAGVIIMGSPHSVNDPLPWLPKAFERLTEILDRQLPVLGVCFGHQMLCQALGGRVSRSDNGYEVGTVKITASAAGLEDPLIGPIFGGATLTVNESHGDTVTDLPEQASILAYNEHDPHQALRLAENIWSVQFHPEIGQREAQVVLNDYRDALEQKGYDVDALIAAARQTPGARSLVRRFIKIVRREHG
jgi:GMP synthase (glutamine-hydrolysing)